MATETSIAAEHAAATTRAVEAMAARDKAQEALFTGPPSKATLDKIALLSQAAALAAWERDFAAYRLARYRIARRGFRSVSHADRTMRHPGAKPWSLDYFAAHHGIDVGIVRTATLAT